MIFRRLVVGGDPPVVVELHPRVTVVTGLPDGLRARLVDAIAGFLQGEPSDIGGTFVVDGTELDIEPDVLELLELPADVPNIVIRAGDLNQLVARADEKSVTPSGWSADLDADAPVVNTRFGPVASDDTGLGDISSLYASPSSDDETDQLDEPGAVGTFVPERQGWSWTTPDPSSDESVGSLDAVEAREAEIETEIVEIRRRLAELEDAEGHTGAVSSGPTRNPERVAVSAALEAFRWVRSWMPDVLPDAVAVADRIADLRREQVLSRRDDVPEWLRAQARQQLEEAQVEMDRAEREVRPAQVPADAAAALEAAHTAVDEAEERARKRMAGPIAARRLAAARAQEEEILAQLGLPSYAAYLLLRASSGNVDADGERRLAVARAALTDAEAMWAEVNGENGGEDDEAVRDRERDLRAQAVDVLGPDAAIVVSEVTLDRLEVLLREQRMPAPDWRPAAEGLVEALLDAGVDVPDLAFEAHEGDYDRLDDVATDWLVSTDATNATDATDATGTDEHLHDTERVRAALLDELDGLERTLVELRAAQPEPVEVFEPASPFEPELEPEATFEPEPEPVVTPVAALEPERPLSAVERLRRLRDETSAHLDALASEVSSLTRQFEQGDAVEPAPEPEADPEGTEPEPATEPATEPAIEVALSPIEELDDYLTGRFDEVREVGGAGSLPMIFDEVLHGQPDEVADALFARLAEESQTVQVVMISDDQRAVEWATDSGDASVFDAAFEHNFDDPFGEF